MRRIGSSLRLQLTVVVTMAVFVVLGTATPGLADPISDLINTITTIHCDPAPHAPQLVYLEGRLVMKTQGDVLCNTTTAVDGQVCLEVGLDPEIGGPPVECVGLTPTNANAEHWRGVIYTPCAPGPWISHLVGHYATGSVDATFDVHSGISEFTVQDCLKLSP